MLTLTILCLFFSLAQALPTLLSRDVFDPPITSPTASTVWQSGETVTVTWDTSNVPSQLTNPIGMVVLGYMANAADSEHLMLDSPLAQGFNITDGSVSFVVPSVVTRTDYIICLFGDSGNISPMFTIEGTSSSSSAAASTTSALSSSAVSSASPSSTTSAATTVVSTQVTTATAVTVSSASGATIVTTAPATGSSVTSTFTSIITETPSSSSSRVATTSSVSSASSSASKSSSATSSSTTTPASNSAWKTNTQQSQVYAFAIASLFAACLL